MQIGDLVKVVNEWTGHNPWMVFPDDPEVFGLITYLDKSFAGVLVCTVLLFSGEEVVVSANRCEVINESR